MSRQIPLTQGKFAIVDDEDYKWLSQQKWYYSLDKRTGYALRKIIVNGKHTSQRMHRAILGLKRGEITDHVNRNGLDNRRCNLRKCTQSQNNRNSRKNRNNTSGYIGVSWNKEKGRWSAYIKCNTKQIHLGYFDDLEQAAQAYDIAALELHGAFATLNFPQEE